MGIPKYHIIMLPLLKLAADKKENSFREAVGKLAQEFNLTEEEIRELYPSGNKRIFEDRVGWASTYLKKALLLDSQKRGHFQITDRGLKVLSQNPLTIDDKFLMQFPEFIEFKKRSKKNVDNNGTGNSGEHQTPEEAFEYSYQSLRDNLATELLEMVKSCSFEFFENLVVDLLLNMGYGGSRKDAGEAIGHVGDEGIDGIIKEDKLGLDIIYIQAKRWQKTVTRPEIHKFVGALEGKGAQKGVFITTANFSKKAIEYKPKNSKVILIDGEHLAQLMIDFDIGVSKIKSYDLKKIDSDYFILE